MNHLTICESVRNAKRRQVDNRHHLIGRRTNTYNKDTQRKYHRRCYDSSERRGRMSHMRTRQKHQIINNNGIHRHRASGSIVQYY